MKACLRQLSSTHGHPLWSHWRGQALILLVLWSFFTPEVYGQTKLWDKAYGGPDGDFMTALQHTSDGGYILGGYSYSDKGGDKSKDTYGECISAEPYYRYLDCVADFWVIKVDAAGKKQWNKTFGGLADDRLVALQQTSDGGFILGGTSLSGPGGDKTQDSLGRTDYWVVKLDAAGNKQWDKTFGGADKDDLSSLRQTSDGGYLLGGDSYSDIGGDKSEAKMTRCVFETDCTPDYWVLKLDAAGNKVWDRTLGGRALEHLAAVQQTVDGGYILGGYSYSGMNGNKTAIHQGPSADFWLVKLDATGKITWDKSYGNAGRDLLTALQLTSDGGYIVGGYVHIGLAGDITGDHNGDTDYWVLKLDAEGNKQWDKTFGGRDSDFLRSVQQTSEGGYILGGWSNSRTFQGEHSWGTSGSWVIKLDAAGNKQWDKVFRTGFAFAGLQQTRDGDYILGATGPPGVFGDKTQVGRGQEDYWILKIAGGFAPIPLLFNSFSPKKGLPGSTVTITGENLFKTKSVWFYGAKLKKAKFQVVSNTMIRAVVPHSAKSGKIFLFSVDDTVESAASYLVRQPVITSLSPGQGPVGTTVTLKGDRFATAKEVYFNEVLTLEFTVVSDERMTAVVPEGATTGPVRVLLQGGGQVTSKVPFNVIPPAVPEIAKQELARKVTPAEKITNREEPVDAVFPNPFQGQVTYRFSVSQPQPVTVKVYDLLGREVAVLFQGEIQARQAYQVTWRPKTHHRTGFYLIRLQTPGKISQQKVLLSR